MRTRFLLALLVATILFVGGFEPPCSPSDGEQLLDLGIAQIYYCPSLLERAVQP